MKIIQTNCNSQDFQSRLITIKPCYDWKSFCEKIINCPIGDCIRDEDMIIKTEPMLAGIMIPRHNQENFETINHDNVHLRISFYLFNGMKCESLFYLLKE